MGFLDNVASGYGQYLGAAIDPLNISGKGGIPGVNSGGNGLIGYVDGANAKDDAVSAQREGANAGNAALTTAYGTEKSTLQPTADIGNKALQTMSNGFGMNGQQVLNADPGYQFRLDQGNQAISASAAARGLGNSGATLKALTRYGQDYASNEYNNAYNRQYSNLSTLAGYGQQANAGLANAAGTYGQSMSNNYTGMANAIGAANIAQSNSITGLAGQGAMAAGMYFSDERLKTNIESIEKDELNEMKSFLRAYAYNYKNQIHGEGEWIGVMAQDLEKSKLGRSLVFEDYHGNKAINTKKVLSLFLATMAEAS